MAKSVKATVKGKVGSSLKKISKGADWIGAIAGYLGTIQTANEAYGTGEFLPNIINLHVNAVTRHNIREVTTMAQGRYIADPNWNPILITGAIMAIGGKVATMLPSFIPHQTTIGSIVAKAGFGAAVGSGLAMLVGALAFGSSSFDSAGSGGGKTQGSATTSGRISFPNVIKSQASYPSDGRKVWSTPKD